MEINEKYSKNIGNSTVINTIFDPVAMQESFDRFKDFQIMVMIEGMRRKGGIIIHEPHRLSEKHSGVFEETDILEQTFDETFDETFNSQITSKFSLDSEFSLDLDPGGRTHSGGAQEKEGIIDVPEELKKGEKTSLSEWFSLYNDGDDEDEEKK